MRLFATIFLVCLGLTPLVLPVRGDTAREETFAEENCALTLPAGWRRLDGFDQPGLFAAFCNHDRSRVVLLLARERGHAAKEIDDAGVTALERGVKEAGGRERLSGKFVEVAGYRAYERLGTLPGEGQQPSLLMVAIPTGDGIYLLEALASGAKASEDAEIRQTLGSFRFLRSPGPPQNAAYRLGYLFGQVFFVVVVVGSLIWLVVWAVSRNRSSAHRTPPGYPPYPVGPVPPSSQPPLPPSAPPPPPPPPR